MNKLAKAVAVVGTIGLAGGALAANPATFNITVNMGGTLSVAIMSGAPIALGVVTANQIAGNAVAVVVRNDSTGLVEDYNVSVGNSAGLWTIGAAQASNTATLHMLFNTTEPLRLPVLGDYLAADQLIGLAGPVLAGTLATEPFVGDQDGQNVAPNEDVSLWIRFGAPSGDTTGGAAQSFQVTINAVAP